MVTPGNGCTLSFAAVYGEIDALAERARMHGGGQVEGPADTPWNTRDLTTADPDGNVVVFTAGRPPNSPTRPSPHKCAGGAGNRADLPA